MQKLYVLDTFSMETLGLWAYPEISRFASLISIVVITDAAINIHFSASYYRNILKFVMDTQLPGIEVCTQKRISVTPLYSFDQVRRSRFRCVFKSVSTISFAISAARASLAAATVFGFMKLYDPPFVSITVPPASRTINIPAATSQG